MKISVITPVFNGEKHIIPLIRSVRAQTMQDFEHVIVDDGSTDGTAELVRRASAEDPRITFVQQANAGLSAARNIGALHSSPTSELLLFVDHDDLLRPHALDVLSGALKLHPDALAAHGGVAAIDDTGAPIRLVRDEASVRRTVVRPERLWSKRSELRTLRVDEFSTFDALAYMLFIYSCGQVMLRRTTFEQMGGFDPVMRVAQDYDMWLRVSSVSGLAFVAEVVMDYRQTSVSMSANQAAIRREDLHARFKAISDPGSTSRTLARHLHRHHEWHRAAQRLELARHAAQNGDRRAVTREVVRMSKAALEAAVAVLPWPALWGYRVRRFHRNEIRSRNRTI